MVSRLKNRATNIAIHTILWLLSIQLMFEIDGLYNDIKTIISSSNVEAIDDSIIIIPILIALFYINGTLLVKVLLNKKLWWIYIISTLILMFILISTSVIVYDILIEKNIAIPIDRYGFIEITIILSTLTNTVSTSIYASQIMFVNYEKQKIALEKQKSAEIELLSSQINPHFLFNTLNSIYYLSTEEKSPRTAESILKLSEIMRYPVNEGHKKIVSLSMEINFLRDFIDLQKIRLGTDYPIHIDFPNETENFHIAPLLFIPFVENSFKYGVSTSNPKSIDISIKINNNTLTFSCTNHIIKNRINTISNTGIKNAEERLKLLYKNKHNLLIKEINNKHIVTLILNK
jgi:sensor histidine kinase YesM